MHKILIALGLVAAMLLSTGITRAEDAKEKKGRFQGKLKGRFDPEKLFEKMDADSDGKVTKKEFKAFFENLGKIGEKLAEFADTIFDRLDEDGNGKLTKDELKKLGNLREKLGGLRGKFKGKFKKKDE